MRDRCRVRVVLRVVLGVAAAFAVLVSPLPGAAAQPGVGAEVAAARAVWQAAQVQLDERRAFHTNAEHELAAGREREEQAAERLDTETALLITAERELERAVQSHEEAVAASAEATMVFHRQLAAQDRAHAGALDRHAELGRAAATAYAHGDPQSRMLNSVIYALDNASTVGDFLTATERLGHVTVDARAASDAAIETLVAQTDATERARLALDQRRGQERVANTARGEAEVAADRQRAIQREALVVHEAALVDVARLGDALEAAVAAVAQAEHDLAVARANVRALGWRAGVPGSAELVWPVDGRPGSGFGQRLHPIHGDVRPHLGVDIAGPTGLAVVAAADGRVVSAGPRGGYGLTVVIDHGQGRTTLYAHLSSIGVRRGQRVAEAERIGALGSTGLSTGPHLHFEVRIGGSPQDPMRFFR